MSRLGLRPIDGELPLLPGFVGSAALAEQRVIAVLDGVSQSGSGPNHVVALAGTDADGTHWDWARTLDEEIVDLWAGTERLVLVGGGSVSTLDPASGQVREELVACSAGRRFRLVATDLVVEEPEDWTAAIPLPSAAWLLDPAGTAVHPVELRPSHQALAGTQNQIAWVPPNSAGVVLQRPDGSTCAQLADENGRQILAFGEATLVTTRDPHLGVIVRRVDATGTIDWQTVLDKDFAGAWPLPGEGHLAASGDRGLVINGAGCVCEVNLVDGAVRWMSAPLNIQSVGFVHGHAVALGDPHGVDIFSPDGEITRLTATAEGGLFLHGFADGLGLVPLREGDKSSILQLVRHE